MPNWCSNTLTLRHEDPAMIERAAGALTAGTFLNEFFPCPPELHEHESPQRNNALAERFIREYGASDWYDWQVKNWGTKWDICADNGVDRDSPNELTAGFDSAWSPPIEAYEKLLGLGFEVRAHYYEPGMCFVGTYDNGDDDYIEYGGETAATVRDVIGAELDDMFGISESMAEYEEEEEENG